MEGILDMGSIPIISTKLF